MLLRILLALAMVFCTALATCSPSLASVDPTTDQDSGTVTVAAESNSGSRGESGDGGSGPSCSWAVLYLDRDPATEAFTEGDIPFSRDGVGPAMTRDIRGVEHTLYRVVCPNGPVSDRWVPTGITVVDLIDTIRDEAEATVPLPVSKMNPGPDAGGIVNLGLWLAVEPQSVGTLSAEAGSVWITLTPELISTRWEFGNGDAVSCDGVGIPIEDAYPDMNVQDQSPTCGYTYRQSSPDENPFVVTLTTSWALEYQSSSGSGALPILERTVSFEYDVDEIQTVGIAN